MEYWKFLYNEIRVSKAYQIMAYIVLISLALIIIFGPTVGETQLTNVLSWIVYIIFPAVTNTIGGVYLQYHKQENNILAILGLMLASYVILLAIITLFNGWLWNEFYWNSFLSAVRVSLILYTIIATTCFFTLLQILKMETLIKDNKKYTPEILKAIPLPKRGDLWGLKANDHYVDIITSRGNHLIYSSLAGAIDNSSKIEGARIHRSYWVARDGLKDITRKNNRYVCILKNDMEIIASRNGVEEMKRLEWIA